jgi:hypothetical protein
MSARRISKLLRILEIIPQPASPDTPIDRFLPNQTRLEATDDPIYLGRCVEKTT